MKALNEGEADRLDEARQKARAELLNGLIRLLEKRSAELHGNGQDKESETVEEVLALLRLELETG